MLRRPFLIAVTAAALGFALPALAANPQVEFDTTAGKILRRALSRRRAENGREFSRLRQSQALRRHAVPPRDRRLHDPGRRLHAGLQGEADASPPIPIESEQSSKAGLLNRAGYARDGADVRSELGDRAVLHQCRRQQVPQLPRGRRRKATDTRCSARSSREWTSSTRSRRAPTGAGGPFPKDVPAEKVIINKAVVVDAEVGGPIMVILHTNHGDITLELDAENAPATRRELPAVRPRRPLRQHDLPSRDRRLHGPGRRHGAGDEAEARARAGRQRGGQRPEEQALHGRDGAHVRPALGDRAVLHQRRRQRFPRPQGAEPAGLGLLRVRQGHRAGRTSSTRSRAWRRPTAASTRTCRREDVMIERAEEVR